MTRLGGPRKPSVGRLSSGMTNLRCRLDDEWQWDPRSITMSGVSDRRARRRDRMGRTRGRKGRGGGRELLPGPCHGS